MLRLNKLFFEKHYGHNIYELRPLYVYLKFFGNDGFYDKIYETYFNNFDINFNLLIPYINNIILMRCRNLDEYKIKDSGVRQDFPSGSVRDIQKGKGRYDLISPVFMRRLAVHTEGGAAKYGERNWEKGIPNSRYFDSAVRHLINYQAGFRDEDHLAAAAWNIMCIIHNEEQIKKKLLSDNLSDMPTYY
jgi:hypothetical protein